MQTENKRDLGNYCKIIVLQIVRILEVSKFVAFLFLSFFKIIFHPTKDHSSDHASVTFSDHHA